MGEKAWWRTLATLAVVALLVLTSVEAQKTYAMNYNSVCDTAGFETIATGSNARVLGKGSGGTGDRLSCTVRFTVSERDVQLRLVYRSVNINSCGVELHVQAYGDSAMDSIKCGPLPTLNTKISKEGKVIIRLDRRNINDNDYNFDILVEAFKPSPQYGGTDSNPVAVGLVVGVVGGILFFLVLMAIIGVCCYKRVQRAKQRELDYKQNLAEVEGAECYENNVSQNGISSSSEYQDSPRGKRKLLGSQKYRDEAKHEERLVDAPASPIPPPPPISALATSPRKKSAFDFEDVPQRRENGGTGRSTEKENPDTPKSPMLAALHGNPKFRATFEATEVEAETRAQRFSYHSTGGESQSSLASSASQPPPPLPAVPKGPKSPAPRRQNVAGIRRAPRLSSSAEEVQGMERFSDSDDDKNIRLLQNNGPPSPSEIVPIKVNDPHMAEPKQKLDTKHTLRPNRRRSPESKPSSKEPTSKAKEPHPSDLDSVAGRSVASAQGGMFKKANSLRKRSGKSPRLGRASRSSVGNALEDGESRPTTPTSMRGFDDDDLDDYPPLKRTGSRQSLYASRNSLYNRRGRRERNNSIGESVYSYAHDDIEAYRRHPSDEYEDVMPRRMSRRSFRSLGDLEYAMRETGTQTLRETATQTGKGRASASSSKLHASKRSGSSRSLGAAVTQNAAAATPKGTRKAGKNAKTNTDGTPKSARKASRDNLEGSNGKEEKVRKKKTKSTSSGPGDTLGTTATSTEPDLPEPPTQAVEPLKPKPKPKPKPRPRPRKSQSVVTNQTDEDEGEGEEGAPATTLPSNVASQPGMMPVMVAGQPGAMAYAPQYVMTPQGLMLAQPYPPMQPMYPAAQPPVQTAVPTTGPQPPTANGGHGHPSKSNWDLLCDLTAGHQAAQPSDMASVTGSVFSSAVPQSISASQGYGGNPQRGGHPPPLPAYGQMSAALSDHGSYSYEAGPRQSRTPRSSSSGNTPPVASSTPPPSNLAKKSSWEALKEATDSPYRMAFNGKSNPSDRTESIV